MLCYLSLKVGSEHTLESGLVSLDNALIQDDTTKKGTHFEQLLQQFTEESIATLDSNHEGIPLTKWNIKTEDIRKKVKKTLKVINQLDRMAFILEPSNDLLT